MTEYFISEPKTKENQADFISIMNKFYSMQAYSLLLGFAEYWNGSESDVFYDENYYSSLLALIEKTHKNLVEAQDIYVEKYFK